MKKLINYFLKDDRNFSDNNMTEATFQFELGWFLRENGYDGLKFEHQFCNNLLKKEADLYIENNNSKICIELKKINEYVKCSNNLTRGVTYKLASAFEDICFLQQLKNKNQITEGFFILVTNDLGMLNSNHNSMGSKFWRNKPTTNLSEYKITDLPPKESWNHSKLRTFIQNNQHSNIESNIEYKVNKKYAFCIFTI